MEHIACPLCETDRTSLVFNRKDYAYGVSSQEFSVVRCRRCGLVYINPRPTIEEIQTYYPVEFYATHLDSESLLREKQRQLCMKHHYVKTMRPGRLLDVGCMKGEFLYFMKQRGWQVQGVEFSSKPPNLFGLEIYYGDLQAAGLPAASFDLITMWAVLEHVYGPRQVLSEACRLLKPGGRLVALVTNFRSLPARLMRHDDIPRHTTLFTKRTLAQMMRRCGLTSETFHFNCELFGGNHRGLLNYLVKMAAGERMEEIVAQNRSAGRWQEFSSQLKGHPSKFMGKVDQTDRLLFPYLDRLFDSLHLGFILVAVASKSGSRKW